LTDKIIVIAGPTAVGKTRFAIEAAQMLNGEIVSADSMQLYKHMNIGSAKPDAEELSRVKHHLVDEISPHEPFSVARYQKLAKAAIADIFKRGKQPVISGGTGLYINSLIYDMDFTATPAGDEYRRELEALAAARGNEYVHKLLSEKDTDGAERIHPNNLKKVIRALEVIEKSDSKIKPFEKSFIYTTDYMVELICLNRDRQKLYERIDKRVDMLIEKGLVSEVKSLLGMGLTEKNISMNGIGYKEIIGYFNEDYALEDAIDKIKQNTRNYAKRQLTWLRRYKDMKWFNLSEYPGDNEAVEDILKWLKRKK
jgi:tRNA dimethylallyltransferase